MSDTIEMAEDNGYMDGIQGKVKYNQYNKISDYKLWLAYEMGYNDATDVEIGGDTVEC
jgi:ribosome modulation factor